LIETLDVPKVFDRGACWEGISVIVSGQIDCLVIVGSKEFPKSLVQVKAEVGDSTVGDHMTKIHAMIICVAFLV